MKPHSLRLRLVLASALTIAIALSVAGVVLATLFGDHLQRSQVRDLTTQLDRLAALVDPDASPLRLTQTMSDPRFAVPFGGIYWQVSDPANGEMVRSRSSWDQVLAIPAPPDDHTVATGRVVDPEGAAATGLSRRLEFALDNGGKRVLDIGVVEDLVELDAARTAYNAELFQALLVLAVLLTAAATVQITVGLRPLVTIRQGINAIRTGTSNGLAGKFPAEVEPLVSEVNQLIEAQELSIEFARARAADLAHGLKSSLQVLNAEAHNLREGGNERSAATIEDLTEQMSSMIDHQLVLARLRQRGPGKAVATELAPLVGRLVTTLRKTARGAAVEWETEIAPASSVALDSADLTELLGVLLENAMKWCRGRVRVSASDAGGSTIVVVEDDGAGVPPDQLARLGERGFRLDETRSGTGIGLAIAREIVSMNAGTLAFRRSDLGGLAVSVSIPSPARIG